MDAATGIPCVIYAAKSTADVRGSIPEQLRECRQAIQDDKRQRFIAEYSDEVFSAYRKNRGPGLRDALEHAEDLAAEHGIAELWAQHSDRIARGDGRAAQHTVEIALWALKHDVRVRTLQDPDTFRDLLYAVVTGQRNNEDSKRKALATQAGRRRAIARGEFVSHLPDGYRLQRELDESGKLRKRLVIDPEREPLFRLLFRLALRGRSCGQIARTLNDRGWLTKPARRIDRPKPFDANKVYDLLCNPRYAALAVYRGEVLARGHWPAYISERRHERIKARLANPREGRDRGPVESYLLKGLARCGRCGAPLRVHSRRAKRDGTRSRAYVCAAHRDYRGKAQCEAAPLDAHVTEAMVIATLPLLLDTGHETPGYVLPVAQGSGPDVGHTGERPPAAAEPSYTSLAAHVVGSQRRARELAEAKRMREWIEREAYARTEDTRAEAEELARVLAGRAAPARPSASTVRARFGGWNAALYAAGLNVRPAWRTSRRAPAGAKSTAKPASRRCPHPPGAGPRFAC